MKRKNEGPIALHRKVRVGHRIIVKGKYYKVPDDIQPSVEVIVIYTAPTIENNKERVVIHHPSRHGLPVELEEEKVVVVPFVSQPEKEEGR